MRILKVWKSTPDLEQFVFKSHLNRTNISQDGHGLSLFLDCLFVVRNQGEGNCLDPVKTT